MTHQMAPNRRRILAGLAAGLALPAGGALAQPFLDAREVGLDPDSTAEQSAAFAEAMRAAAAAGRVLHLPGGRFMLEAVEVPSGLVLRGVPGRTILASLGGTVLRLAAVNDIVFEDLVFEAASPGTGDDRRGLVEAEGAGNVRIGGCGFSGNAGTGIDARDSEIAVVSCRFANHGDAAVHSMDGRGLTVTGCTVSDCGNAGIRIWRSSPGTDPSIVSGNRISRIDWRGGGNGQNGNGVNVFRADGVIVANNHIADCAFTAVRLNATRNAQVSGNACLNSGEVAIFSEFEFSGSIVANNVVDGAATGISITNLDSGGHLAVCTGNIVRNVFERSEVNPDTVPIGIFAEADTLIASNTVDNVPGMAIGAGYGPYLRNVLISANVVTGSRIGIGVSVVEGAGAVHIADNLVAGAGEAGIAGMRWLDVAEPDLAANAGRHANVSVSGNRVAPAG